MIHLSEIVMGMATVPSRLPNLRQSVPVLLSQCDRLHLHINGRGHLPAELHGHPKIRLTRSDENRGDQAKFLGVPECRGYYFMIDDDILYPPDYVARHLAVMRENGNRCISTVHGDVFNPFLPVAGIYHRNFFLNFEQPLERSRRVMGPGTGTACFYAPDFKMLFEDCPVPNMADFWTAAKAVREGVPVICIARPAQWMKQLDTAGVAIHRQMPMAAIEQVILDNLAGFRDRFLEITGRATENECLPKVSVIVATKDRPGGLKRTLDSLRNQIYPHLETIVVNSGKEDVSSLIESYREDLNPGHIVSPQSLDLMTAWRAGLTASGGDLLMFLDDCDACLPFHVGLLVTMSLFDREYAGWYTATAHMPIRQEGGIWVAAADPVIQGAAGAPGAPDEAREVPCSSLMCRRGAVDCASDDALFPSGPLRFFGRPTVEKLVFQA